MTEVIDTYSTNEEVERRLQLGEQETTKIEAVRDVRRRAYRWIKHEYSKRDKTAPSPGSLTTTEEILQDIEADMASYFYLRDKMEWVEREKGRGYQKLSRWKEDATDNLLDLFRTLYVGTYYGIGGQ